jgi:hypothetical protein
MDGEYVSVAILKVFGPEAQNVGKKFGKIKPSLC